MKRVVALAAGVALSGAVFGAACSQWPAAGQDDVVLLPGELAADPEKYDGKHVTVRGYVVLGPETRNIADSKASYEDGHGACLGLSGPAAMFTGFHERYVEKLSGVFRRKLCGERDVCLYWCSSSGVELDGGSKP